MKIILLVLSGDSQRARAVVQEKYPDASVKLVSRAELEKHSIPGRIRFLRKLHPEVFAVATERLVWQRGQNALLAFGALAGAQRVLIFDSYGDTRDERRTQILSRAASRFAQEWAASRVAITRSRLRLKELQHAIKSRTPAKPHRNDSNPLRIVYLRSTPSPGTPAGGAASHINGFVNAVRDLGAEVQIISNDHIADVDESILTLIEPEPTGSTRAAFDLHNNLIFSDGVLREVERRPVDLIYQRYGRFTWAGIEASLRVNAPLFLEYNGSEVWIGKHWDISGMLPLLEQFERLNLAAAARIFVVSEVERENLLRTGLVEDKIVVNPNGVDTEKFRPNNGGVAIRQELGIANGEMLIGFVGTFGPWHGVETLAEAIVSMPERCNLNFLLIGSGRLREEVERIVRSAGKEHRVIFAGQVPHERVPAMLDACDILLSPHVPLEDGSSFFGSPTKLFEYMAMGKGIIASRLGQIGDVLVDEKTALLIEPGNARELKEAILRFSESPELRARLGTAARQAAVAQHTWLRNAQSVLDTYREWIDSPGS